MIIKVLIPSVMALMTVIGCTDATQNNTVPVVYGDNPAGTSVEVFNLALCMLSYGLDGFTEVYKSGSRGLRFNFVESEANRTMIKEVMKYCVTAYAGRTPLSYQFGADEYGEQGTFIGELSRIEAWLPLINTSEECANSVAGSRIYNQSKYASHYIACAGMHVGDCAST